MAIATFQGPVRSLNGFISDGPGAIKAVSTATLTLDDVNYGGRIINITAATTTITLPALNAAADPSSAGPGSDPNSPNNLGLEYRFFLSTAASGSGVKVITAASNFLLGSAFIAASAITDTTFFANGTTIRSINLDGTTTGGIAGSYFSITAVTATQWLVQGALLGSGSLATPFATS
jgi:hypothetical protein